MQLKESFYKLFLQDILDIGNAYYFGLKADLEWSVCLTLQIRTPQCLTVYSSVEWEFECRDSWCVIIIIHEYFPTIFACSVFVPNFENPMHWSNWKKNKYCPYPLIKLEVLRMNNWPCLWNIFLLKRVFVMTAPWN